MARIGTFPNQQLIVDLATRNQKAVIDRQVQISSGFVSTRYSGIAPDSQRLVNLENAVARTERFIQNGQQAQLRLQTMEGVASNMFDIASNMKSLLVQATNSNQAQDLNLGTEASNALDQVEDLLNTRLDGRYLFAGSNTNERAVDFSQIPLPSQTVAGNTVTSDAALLTAAGVTTAGNLRIANAALPGPGFVDIAYNPATDSLNTVVNAINTDSNLQTAGIRARVTNNDGTGFRLVIEDIQGDTMSVSDIGGDIGTALALQSGLSLTEDKGYYQGDRTLLEVRMDENFDLEYGVTADEDAFERLIRGLRIAANTTDPTALNEALALMDEAVRNLPDIRAEIGIDLKQIDRLTQQHDEFRVNAEGAISSIETVDVTEAMALLAVEETQLQASYITISRLQNLTLTQFLR